MQRLYYKIMLYLQTTWRTGESQIEDAIILAVWQHTVLQNLALLYEKKHRQSFLLHINFATKLASERPGSSHYVTKLPGPHVLCECFDEFCCSAFRCDCDHS